MTKNLEELKALIGLRMCEGIGDISAYKILSFCGSASSVFEEKREHLSGISGVSPQISEYLDKGIDWDAVEKELEYIDKNNLSYITIFDKEYPTDLLYTESPPTIIFFKGNIERINQAPNISIVGTRKATRYGLDAVEEIIDSFKNLDVNIISGLAHGIDIACHKKCLETKIPTFGVVGHGMKTIYPAIHMEYAKEMAFAGGGILTEYFSDEIPNRENFPKRNRIIAGISFATFVIEAAPKSGTLITADYALKYNRKVFALPGRYNDKASEGCNLLLKNTKAKPILSIRSLHDELGFKKKKTLPPKEDLQLTAEENLLIGLLEKTSKSGLDNIAASSNMNISLCTSILFNLEMKGLIRSLPGKSYELA